MFKIPIPELKEKAYRIRRSLIELVYRAGSGHLDTSLSLVEVWLAIVYSDFFRFDPQNGAWTGRDVVFLSEGHACPLQYMVNADLGYYSREDVFAGNRRPFTPFQGHTNRSLIHGFENSNGSLGIGLWQAYGYALETDRSVFCIAGDGEFEEPISLGLLTAPHHVRYAPNFTLLINNNGLAQDNVTNIGPLAEAAKLYGWMTQRVDGHNFQALGEALQSAHNDNIHPRLIICETVKGKGGHPQHMGKLGHHGVAPKDEAELQEYLAGLEMEGRV